MLVHQDGQGPGRQWLAYCSHRSLLSGRSTLRPDYWRLVCKALTNISPCSTAAGSPHRQCMQWLAYCFHRSLLSVRSTLRPDYGLLVCKAHTNISPCSFAAEPPHRQCMQCLPWPLWGYLWHLLCTESPRRSGACLLSACLLLSLPSLLSLIRSVSRLWVLCPQEPICSIAKVYELVLCMQDLCVRGSG